MLPEFLEVLSPVPARVPASISDVLISVAGRSLSIREVNLAFLDDLQAANGSVVDPILWKLYKRPLLCRSLCLGFLATLAGKL